MEIENEEDFVKNRRREKLRRKNQDKRNRSVTKDISDDSKFAEKSRKRPRRRKWTVDDYLDDEEFDE